ncbi:hypothetical protein [Thalassobaculum litoreum]|uniref:Uncharacterized protein n=1 Tax=Thalassobaculum litoreum DSM 18839 TaxID=1123362 RepID=A0A8G2EWV5_9PROT|nr:hypothetical protein [Thalassobaculum litoreum]SDG44449.1 hypothetical protein SAMN05660686_04450 [Thalassobaculum litoreum DSM 18839]
MTNYARIIEQDGVQVIAEVVGFDPATKFTPSIAALFVEASEGMVYRAQYLEGEWVPPSEPEPDPEPAPAPPAVITRIQFMQLFSITEQSALRAQGRLAPDHQDFDANFDAFWQMLNDPQLTEVNLGHAMTVTGVNYLESVELIGEGRAAEVLANTAPS